MIPSTARESARGCSTRIGLFHRRGVRVDVSLEASRTSCQGDPVSADPRKEIMKMESLATEAVSPCPASQDHKTPPEWTTIIQPQHRWWDIDIAGVWKYRDLIKLFVRRDLVAQYKQTILGPLWFVLGPIFTTVVMTVVFGRIAQIPTDGIPDFLFYMSGTVMWGYISTCFSLTSDTFVANQGIFGKVYFPRLAVPVSVVISNLMRFLIQFCVFIGFLCYFVFKGSLVIVNSVALSLPFLVLEMALLGLGLGILVSSVTTKYRDVAHVMGFAVSLWMYASPVIYPMSQVPERWRFIYALNPASSIIEVFRLGFLGTSVVTIQECLTGLIVTLAILSLGVLLFSKIERTFMDTV